MFMFNLRVEHNDNTPLIDWHISTGNHCFSHFFMNKDILILKINL